MPPVYSVVGDVTCCGMYERIDWAGVEARVIVTFGMFAICQAGTLGMRRWYSIPLLLTSDTAHLRVSLWHCEYLDELITNQ